MESFPRPTGLLVGSIVVGVFTLLTAIWTSHDSGAGSGFRGYTTGFRVRLWLTYALGLIFVAQGIVGLVWWDRLRP